MTGAKSIAWGGNTFPPPLCVSLGLCSTAFFQMLHQQFSVWEAPLLINCTLVKNNRELAIKSHYRKDIFIIAL